MADTIKIGNDNATYKVGSTDVSAIYLGNDLVYAPSSGLPAGYTQVEYVENDSLAYIDTGFKPNQDTRIIAEMQVVTSTSYNPHFGCDGWETYNGIRMGYEPGIDGTLHVKYGNNNGWTVYPNVHGDLNKHTYDWNKNYFYMDGSLVGSYTYGNFQTTSNLGIFFVIENGSPTSQYICYGRVYSFKIYDDGTLVRDFVPCTRDSDSKAGVYDIVNDVFYSSANSGYELIAPQTDYTKQYLTFEPISSAVTFSNTTQNFNYSLDYGLTWTTVAQGYTVTANVGQKMMVKGSFGAGPDDNNGNKFITSGGTWKAYGNVLSLVASDDFQSRTAVNANQLINLFKDCTALVDVDNLKIPAYTAGSKAIRGMFRNCSSLVHVPSDLLSTFTAFTSDATAMGMFEDCYSLLETPIIPNMSVGGYGVYGMFNNCTGLTACTCLLTDANISGTKTQDLLNGVNTANGVFYKNPNATWSSSAISNAKIPSGWTIRNYTPTSYTYSVTITGLENGDTTNITWNYGDHIDYNVGNGTYTYTTTDDIIPVDIDSVTDYSLDYSHLDLYSGGSQTVTFTYQGGGGGLVQIPYGTDMLQYVGQSIARLVIGDTSTTVSTYINSGASDYLTITQWAVWGDGQFSSVHSLPIDITLSTPVELTSWGNATTNPFNDLQIEWA